MKKIFVGTLVLLIAVLFPITPLGIGVSGGDILAFNVESCTSVTRIILTITATRG